MHWARLDPNTRRMQLFQQVIIIIVWMILSFNIQFVDGWAHLGGLLCGIIVGIAIWAPENEGLRFVAKLGRPAAVGLMAFFFLITGGLFFAGVVQTKQLFENY